MACSRWIGRGFGLLVLGSMLAGDARGQFAPPPSPSGSSMPPAAMLANPYMNPYLNPYLNPAATQRAIPPGNAALFLYQANAANGGLGSGRISGYRPGPQQSPQQAQAQAKAKAKTRAALMPNTHSVPGAGAAKYFNTAQGHPTGAAQYFNRRGTYFNSTGH